MFFSICIPQYNRTNFLIETLRSIQAQKFTDFEVCISDGGSTDGGFQLIENFLRNSSLSYKIIRSDVNLQYDPNLRSSIAISQGKFILLMGNDDALASSYVLENLKHLLDQYESVAVAITNYYEMSTNKIFRRMQTTQILGNGPVVAANTFRHYSFVSGIIMDGNSARSAATDRCDGGEMYQMYLGARLVSAGGNFLAIDDVCVNKDIQITGESVDSYRTKVNFTKCKIIPRHLPMGRILETVAYGIDCVVSGPTRDKAVYSVAKNLYQYTYPFWIFEYRRVHSFKYSFGVYLALTPDQIAKKINIKKYPSCKLWLLYLIFGIVGFCTPIWFFDKLKPMLYRLAKRSHTTRSMH